MTRHASVLTAEWVAGFIDGEGSLGIAQHGNEYLQPRFRVNLRDDDGDLVRRLRNYFGVGHLGVKRVNPATKHGHIKGRDQVLLNVIGVHCLRIVEVLDQAPLRSKKRFEYPIWRAAVVDYSAHQATRWSPPSLKRRRDARMRVFKQRLQATRVYRGPR